MSGATNAGPKRASAPTATRLRQIALVTKDVERSQRLLTHVLGSEVIYEDAAVSQWGLKNCLIPLGGDLIELVAPVNDGTTAGRLLDKRGEGGYMIIMQTEDAKKRREYIEAKGLGRVIFSHEHGDVVCVQYHPRDVKGGMMPELDSHASGPNNPRPLISRFSPWHACGSDHKAYYPGMKRSGDLTLEGCVLRLQPGDTDHEAAARQWEETFGVTRSRDLLAFTNARVGFVGGREGQPDGLLSITIGVNGRERLADIVSRAKEAGVYADGRLTMCGVQWNLILKGHGQTKL
ncbi:hypothetical protein DE146DRAFT_624502 [Phaeosphaeria sp. MPI-PUGE-AT-0046c]|nr:hypothetical protein DE146DRAFT_624502 [Phaeosphaeria sp. MPI-PUGE-AT-0046c]